MTNANILLIDDNKSILSALEILLRFDYQKVDSFSHPDRIKSATNLGEYSVVLLDMNFSAGINSGNEGLFWLKQILKKAPHTSVILMTAYGSIELAVNGLKEGAVDFVLKPWNNQKLLATIKSAYLLHQSKIKIHQLEQKEQELKKVINQESSSPIIGESVIIQEVLNITHKVAKTDANVLILGENGTGKELFAREIHHSSKRNQEVFISVDMGAVAESLFESELFGHVKGAFTDAKEDRVGKFEAANGGTLFLDEIGNLSLSMQAKLLAVLQNRCVVRVGSNRPIPIDIRLVCATNCNLNQLVDEGLFREDLLYRINTIQLEIPPLRERPKDIPLLTKHFLQIYGSKYDKSSLKINASAQNKLIDYKWPGNIRELQHTIERAIILSEETILTANDFLLYHRGKSNADFSSYTLEEMEIVMIQQALQKHEGNYTAAANQLGISRQTLYNKLKNTKK